MVVRGQDVESIGSWMRNLGIRSLDSEVSDVVGDVYGSSPVHGKVS